MEEKGLKLQQRSFLAFNNVIAFPIYFQYIASYLPDYRLAVGKDGRKGFEIAAEVIPDLIVTDIMMPFVDGFEMCRRLRKDERTSHIPIIMLTAKADIERRIEGLEQGANAYLKNLFIK